MKDDGFTLIELLIVIAIVGLLSAVLLPKLLEAREAAQVSTGVSWGRLVLNAAQTMIADAESIQGFAPGNGVSSVVCSVGISRGLPAPVLSPKLSADGNCKVNRDGAVAIKYVVGSKTYSWNSMTNRVVSDDTAYVDSTYF